MNKGFLFLNKFKLFTYSCRLPTPQAIHLCKQNLNPKLHLHFENRASFQTSSIKNGIFKKLKRNLYNSLSDVSKIKVSASVVYEKIVDETNWNEFIVHFELPDTFNSWFLAVQLHIWMCTLATVSEQQGKYFRDILVDAMWHDVEERMAKLAVMESSKKKLYLSEMFSQFQAAILSYDEGILGDDKDLAASAWRTLYNFGAFDPLVLEDIVFYIRRQVSHLESHNTKDLLFHGDISLLPLKTILEESSKEKLLQNCS